MEKLRSLVIQIFSNKWNMTKFNQGSVVDPDVSQFFGHKQGRAKSFFKWGMGLYIYTHPQGYILWPLRNNFPPHWYFLFNPFFIADFFGRHKGL